MYDCIVHCTVKVHACMSMPNVMLPLCNAGFTLTESTITLYSMVGKKSWAPKFTVKEYLTKQFADVMSFLYDLAEVVKPSELHESVAAEVQPNELPESEIHMGMATLNLDGTEGN